MVNLPSTRAYAQVATCCLLLSLRASCPSTRAYAQVATLENDRWELLDTTLQLVLTHRLQRCRCGKEFEVKNLQLVLTHRLQRYAGCTELSCKLPSTRAYAQVATCKLQIQKCKLQIPSTHAYAQVATSLLQILLPIPTLQLVLTHRLQPAREIDFVTQFQPFNSCLRTGCNTSPRKYPLRHGSFNSCLRTGCNTFRLPMLM